MVTSLLPPILELSDVVSGHIRKHIPKSNSAVSTELFQPPLLHSMALMILGSVSSQRTQRTPKFPGISISGNPVQEELVAAVVRG